MLIVGCSRDKFCNFNLSDSDVIIYRELSAKYFADSLVAERITAQDLCKYEEYQNLIKDLDIQPIRLSKNYSNGCVGYILKQQETWYMEKDFLHMTISITGNLSCFDYDDSDKQFRLNCDNLIEDNMLLRSTTVHN